MARVRRYKHRRTSQIHDGPVPAAIVLAESLGCPEEAAWTALNALVKAGYAVAPFKPTNLMYEAYLGSYGHAPENISSIVGGMGKARARWTAMATVGTARALSRKRFTSIPPRGEHDGAECDEETITSSPRGQGHDVVDFPSHAGRREAVET